MSIDLPRAAAPEPAASQPPARRPGGGAKENFDLSTFYANEGALADSDNNLIPDRVDVLLSADGDGSEGVVDLAARLGLESTGISLPIARTRRSASRRPTSEPILVLIGTSHPIVEQLIKNNKWERAGAAAWRGTDSDREEGVRREERARSSPAATPPACAARVAQLAETFPHIWQRGKDRTTLDDVEDDVRKFVAGRSPAGQAAMSLYKLDQLAAQLQGQGSRVGAREGVRREGRRRLRRRREARRGRRRSRRRR